MAVETCENLNIAGLPIADCRFTDRRPRLPPSLCIQNESLHGKRIGAISIEKHR